MRRRERAFTLIEMAIAVTIMVIMLAMAVPSLNGVLKDRRLRRSLDDMNRLVQFAQEKSILERRAYLICWEKERVIVRPETFGRDEEEAPSRVLAVNRGEAYLLKLPAALVDKFPPNWIFWPSGTCEPAIVSFKGDAGSWSVKYSTLTARGEIASYAAK